jgi:hypothetical protein
MLRVIDLDIEGTLTGDTRVEEIAMVEMPAIEQDFIYFEKQEFESYNDYPQAATTNACRAVKWAEENGWGSCLQAEGKNRANQLCNRENITEETIARMSAFRRHQQHKDVPYSEGCGGIAWDAWGGDAGVDWAERKLEQIRKSKEKMAEVGPRGGIKESDKAPKSDTPNKNPEGEGSAKGDASGKRGAKVTAEQEKTLQGKVDDFNEKESNTKNGNATLGALKSVFQRGLGAFNTSHSPQVKSAEQWAYARVNAFLYLLKNGRPENPKYTTDYDLLPEKHPKSGKKEEMDYAPTLPGYVNYPSGDTSNDMLIKPVLFVEREPGEDKKAYVSRCTAYLIKNEGYDSDQAYAICQSESEDFAKGEKVSFDYDDTLNTPKGRGLAMGEIRSGSEVYIISARGSKEGIYPIADELGIPHDRIFATGSNRLKVQKVKNLRIDRHYDNNEDVIDELGRVGQQFCFTCEPVEYNYSEEELEVKNLLTYLRRTDLQKFEAVVGAMRGRTADEVKKLNHKNPTNYFKYERVLSGSPDRDFCMSIEGRYFRRVEIDVLRDTNIEFGHEGQPYSKWLYKGGPNCVHAWRKYIAQGDVLADQGMAEGLAGTAPKSMPNNGYYSEETKRKSEVAYIVSQGMSKEMFKADTEKRMVYSPLMIPNMLIPRMDEVSNEKYYVKFTPQVIEKIQNLYMIEKRMDKTNYEHTEEKMSDVVMVESWLVSGKSDKAYQLGFNRDSIPDGTWMGGFKVLDTKEGDNIWNNFIKTGKVKGFSVEGNFITNFSRLKNDEYLLQEIINILNKITD